MKHIPLANGRGVATVDDNTYDWLCEHSWYLHDCGYARTCINGAQKYMHRLIMDAKKGQEIDHINRDRLDNRKANLRFCTRFENYINSKPLCREGLSSRFPGVCFDKRRHRWFTQIKRNGKKYFLGYFDLEEEAAKRYQEAVLQFTKA
jgi:hypothetical protein